MKHSRFFIPLTCLVACGEPPETLAETQHEIVNGTVSTTAQFQSVVSINLNSGACTGTFIHPNFILTAAHCLPDCTDAVTSACADTPYDDNIINGDNMWLGRDGTLASSTACDGFSRCGTPGEGKRYTIDYVFFAHSEEFDADLAPVDVVLLHTKTPFLGSVMPVMSVLPSPHNVCSRYAGSRPMIVGFSDNAATLGTAYRRVGVAEAECDIDMHERAFRLDGNPDSFVGSRGCSGDSGGPALWQDASGAIQVGAVMSYTETDAFHSCPSYNAETGVAFIPGAFLDRVLPSLAVTRLGTAGTVTADRGGISCTGQGSGCAAQYDSGTVVRLTAVPAPGSAFASWSGPCAGTTATTCAVYVNSALRVSATFATPTLPLTVRSLPAGTGAVRINPPNTVCTGTCMSSRTTGAAVSLTAVPAAGYVFSNWTGSCNGHSSTCNLSMTAARSVTANFCLQDDACCLHPASCPTCNPKQCPKNDPDCC